MPTSTLDQIASREICTPVRKRRFLFPARLCIDGKNVLAAKKSAIRALAERYDVIDDASTLPGITFPGNFVQAINALEG